jgi:hypothetical protein
MSIKQMALMFLVPALTAGLSILIVTSKWQRTIDLVLIGIHTALHEIGHLVFAFVTLAEIKEVRLFGTRSNHSAYVIINTDDGPLGSFSEMAMLLGPALLNWTAGCALLSYVWTHHVPAWAVAGTVAARPFIFNAGVLSHIDALKLGLFGKLVLLAIETGILDFFVHAVGL